MLPLREPCGFATELPNKIVALDATGKPELYERLFNYEEKIRINDAPEPINEPRPLML